MENVEPLRRLIMDDHDDSPTTIDILIVTAMLAASVGFMVAVVLYVIGWIWSSSSDGNSGHIAAFLPLSAAFALLVRHRLEER